MMETLGPYELNEIYCADCLEALKQMPAESVNCCITSPPYWGLRDYNIDGQVGLESSPEEYVDRLIEVFQEVHRVLRKDGTLWLVLGDSYAGGGCSGGGSFGPERPGWEQCKSKRLPRGSGRYGGGVPFVPNGLKRKDLVGIPWRVAFALQADGWWLRSDIIWAKPNPMPESVTDRPTKAHEYIFLLTKSAKYYYDHDAEKEPHSPDGRKKTAVVGKNGSIQHRDGERWPGTGRNRRTVWTVPTQPFPGAHFAVFPEKLIEPCVLAGCPEGGIVLDPFVGVGTTAVVAQRAGRNFIVFDLNPEYVEMGRKRLGQEELF